MNYLKINPRPSATRILIRSLALATVCASNAFATLVESATESAGTMEYKISGSASITTTTEQVRKGTYAFKHVVSGSSKRAEIDDNSWNAYPKDTYFYAMSYYIPTGWESTYSAIVAQWRFSNLKETGYSVTNCSTVITKNCLKVSDAGGSGWHLTVRDNKWILTVRYPESGCSSCVGMLEKEIDCGTVSKGVWTDFVFKIKWSAQVNGGILSISKAVNKGAYSNIFKNEAMTTWFDTYAPGSKQAGKPVNAGNFTVGHYWSNTTTSHTIYTDEIKVSNDAVNGFNEVKVQ
jgi:hypothetical protein